MFKVLVLAAGVKELSVPVPVPRRSAPAVMPKAEVEHSLDLGPCGTKAGVSPKRERWVLWHGILFEEPNPTGNLWKIPRGDIDGVGEVK